MGTLARGTLWIMHTRPCIWCVRNIVPNLRLPWRRGVPKDVRPAGKKMLRPGSFLLSLSPFGLSSLVTRGWDHAALCVGAEANVVAIAEMTRRGFGVVSWNKFCDHARRVLILECDDFDDDYRIEVVAQCLSYRRVGYDFQFEADDQELTCAELPYQSDFDGRLGIVLEPLWLTGKLCIKPQQILDAVNVSVTWDSAGRLDGKVKR